MFEKKIGNNYREMKINIDDLGTKRPNFIKPSNNFSSSMNKNMLLYNDANRINQNLIMEKSKNPYIGKMDMKRDEERKNIENDISLITREKTTSNYNSFMNINKENNGLSSNRVTYNYQNKNFSNTINNDMTKSKTKPESTIMNNNTYLSKITLGEKNKENDISKFEGKTYYNYNQEYQRKHGGKDNYLENIEKYNSTKNNLNLTKDGMEVKKNDYSNSKSMLANKMINNKSTSQLNTKDYFFDYKAKEPFEKINQTLTNKKQDDSSKKYSTINSNINSSKTIGIKNFVNQDNNDISIKNGSLKFNSPMGINDFKMKKDFSNINKYNTIEPNSNDDLVKSMKLKIENDEKKLNNFENKNNLINKRDNININNNSNKYNLDNIKSYQEKNKNDFKTKINEGQIKTFNNSRNLNLTTNMKILSSSNIKSVENEKNNGKYEQITKKIFDTANNNFNTSTTNYNYERFNQFSNSILDRKSLSVGHGQTGMKDNSFSYDKNINKNYLNSNNFNDTKSNIIKSEYNTNYANIMNKVNTKTRYSSEKKFNINSYLQMNDKNNKSNLDNIKTIYNYNYNSKSGNEQTLSSYSDDANKEINNAKNISGNRNYLSASASKDVLRNNKNESNSFNNNFLKLKTIDNNYTLYSSKNYLNNNSTNYKTLSTNDLIPKNSTIFNLNKTSMISNYSNNKVNKKTPFNSITEYNAKSFDNLNNFKKQNSTRSFSNLSFDLDKEYINNSNRGINTNDFLSNSQNGSLLNKTIVTLSNNKNDNNFNIRNNTVDNRFNYANKFKCNLRKEISSNNANKFIDSDALAMGEFLNLNEKNFKYNTKIGKNIYELNKENGPASSFKKNNAANMTFNKFNKINNNYSYNNNYGNKYYNRNFYSGNNCWKKL